MKKRVLSFLLLLAMLVTMVPTMALGTAAADEGDLPRSATETPVAISSYYELYKTAGLIAFFDAIDPENGTLDLENGKWYARVYNAATKEFEVSDTLFATIKGGVYNAETNQTGWQAYDCGFGYADPDYAMDASALNVIEFDRMALLHNQSTPAKAAYKNWVVDAAVRVDLRDVAEKDGTVNGAFVFGSLSANHATNKQTGGAGKVTWSLVPAEGKTAVDIVKDSASFVDRNGAYTSLFVSKVAISESSLKYTVAHGGASASAAVTAGDHPERMGGFEILKNEQGAVYALRVYGNSETEALSEREARANATVDTLIRLDVSLDIFNKMVEMGGDLVERFLSDIAPATLADAGKTAYEAKIEEVVAEEKEIRAIKVLNDYEKLYVGATGPITRGEGESINLVALFGANGRSVDLENGVWVNKVGDLNATFGNYETGIWQKRADGGVGYTGLYGQFDAAGKLATSILGGEDGKTNLVALTNTVASGSGNTNKHLKTRLNFGLDLLPDEDYTIEYAAKYTPIYVADPNAEDKIARDIDGNPVEFYTSNANSGISSAQYTAPLDYLGLISSWTVFRDGAYSSQMPIRGDVIWMLTDKTPSWGPTTAWVGSKAFTGGGGLLASGIRDYNKVHTYAYTLEETVRTDIFENRIVDATYAVLRDGASYNTQSLTTDPEVLAAADTNKDGKVNDGENWGKVYYDRDDVGDFYLSSSIPTDFYAVRIYDGVLTEKELLHNAFIDMAAYAKANLSEYHTLSADDKERVELAMVGMGFTSDPLEFAANFTAVKDLYAKQILAEDTLYVQSDLRVLTTAYTGKDTGSLVASNAISWFNAAKKGEMITLRGAEWTRRANEQGAGYYILKEYDQMQTAAGRNFGIFLEGNMLPEGDYTIEMVVNPTGVVAFNEDGSYERYIDRTTTYGVHYENGFMIGPLRCLIFPTASDGGGQRSALEKRWCYDMGNECWNNTSSRNHKATENAWKQTALNDIVTYTIDYHTDIMTGKGEYEIFHDGTKISSISLKPEELISNEDANNAFQLMVGMPGGVFSVRVYERKLSEGEKLQNHAADIIYHYNLDTTLLDKLKDIFKDDPTVIYRGLSDLSFDLPKEEAQKIFDARLSALWLSFDGVSIRNDYADGLRYYFTLDETTASAMIKAGYQIEVGAIANVGQGALPSLDGRNYDYRIKAYDGIAGKNNGFFIDRNTFSVTVMAGSSSKQAMLTQVNILGYIRLVSSTGEELVFYVDTPYNGYTPDSFFSIYNYMMEMGEEIVPDAPLLDHLNLVTEGCYEREYIHVNAGAVGGNGTQESPYGDFTTAFKAAKVRIGEINVPTYLYVHAAEGVYEIHELLSIDGAEIPYAYARLVISSADSKGTLTSTRKIDNGKFVEAENNIWIYQFSPDASGNYPDLRYIYVNGKIADMAHNGANNFLIADETRYMTRFYRWDIAPWKNAQAEWEAYRLRTDTLFYPTNKVALNTRFAYYRDQYLVYEELLTIGSKLTPYTVSTAINPSSYYMSLFETWKFNKLAYNEIDALYYSKAGGEDATKTATALETYISTQTDAALVAALTAATEAYNALVTFYSGNTETYNAAVEAYNAALAAYEEAMATLTEGTPEYEAAVTAYTQAQADFAAAEEAYAPTREDLNAAKAEMDAATAALETGRKYIAEYQAAFNTIKADVIKALKSSTKFVDAIAPYALANPTTKYPTHAEVTSTEVNYLWPAAPSTGIYDMVKHLHDAEVLTHESQPVAGDRYLAQELQFYYYRDAFLAMDALEALKDTIEAANAAIEQQNLLIQAENAANAAWNAENPDEEPKPIQDLLPYRALSLDDQPLTEGGSAQYKALFKEYLYKTIAVEELEKIAFHYAIKSPTNAAVVAAWRVAPVGASTTSYVGAPAEYVKIFTEIRDEQIRYNPSTLGDFDAYLPAIKEVDGPYEGKVPNISKKDSANANKSLNTELSESKVYLNVELVGDQAFAIEQGYARLATTAQSILTEAKASYDAAYNTLVDLQKQYEELLDLNKKNEANVLADKVKAARTAAKTAYDNYLAKQELAARYLSDEYDEAFTLEGSGIQLAVCTEWTYNIVSILGVDYDDYIMYNGEKHVAIYCDPSNPMSMHNEGHFKNRMVSLMSSHAYLDKNNEYYYNRLTGTLYYYNTNGIADLTFEYPTMNNMFYLTNAKNVFFENIAFTGLDYTTMNRGFTGGQASSDTNINMVGESDIMPSGAAIYGKMIRGITIRNCNFHDLACEAISFRNRVEKTTVEGNTFTEIGSGAIRFGGGTASSAVWSDKEGTEKCVITNNYLDGIAQQIYCSPAITTQFSKDLECSYNTIMNCSYSGYSIGWSWSWASFMYGEGIKLMHVDIHHNYIASFMQQLGDGGAIYTLGGNAVKEEHKLFNWCHDNYLMMTHTTGDGEGRFACANYHDGSSSNWETYNTVVAAYSFGAAFAGDTFGHTVSETMTADKFSNIDTDFPMDEYVRRLRNNYNRYWAYYEQTLDTAQAFNITLRDNFLINVRSQKTGTKYGSAFFEAYRTGVTAEDFIYVENMSYVYVSKEGKLATIPPKAENIIYDAGCDWVKGDPYDLVDNNY